MSTTTLLDLTDAQMLDYSMDGDTSMQTSTSDWLAIEASMRDDDPVSVTTDYSEAIEVDMEQTYDEDITEFEMMDGEGELDQDGDAELPDVEVNDATHAPSPIVVSLLTSPDFTGQTPLQHSEPFSIEHVSPFPSSIELSHPEVVDFDVSFDHLESRPQEEEVESTPVTWNHATEPLGSIHIIESTIEHPTNLTSTPSAEGYTLTTSEVLTHHDHAGGPEPSLDPSPQGETHLDPPGIANADTGASGRSPPEHLQETNSFHHGNEDAAAENVPGMGSSPQPNRTPLTVVVDAGTNVVDDADNDPHEISDGVYIDPPPAVLLTLSSQAGQSDFSLFNQPSPSGSQSPAASTSSNTLSVSLVLQNRPTLYYEPLSEVFDALRQDEAIFSVAAFADEELILEAYDLDLRIPEDNIYAREVTLHELNVIHDGSDLAGPLRLRLSTSPRFIARYRALRDQIAQMTLNAEDPHAVHDPATETRGEENTGNPSEEQDGSETYLDQNPDEARDQTDRTSNQQLNGEAGAPEDSNTEHVGLEDSASILQAPDHEEADSSTVVQNNISTPQEPPTDLDADNVHNEADTEAGDEYTDHATNADDDNDFGEDLPEDFGGQDGQDLQSAANLLENDEETSEPSETALAPDQDHEDEHSYNDDATGEDEDATSRSSAEDALFRDPIGLGDDPDGTQTEELYEYYNYQDEQEEHTDATEPYDNEELEELGENEGIDPVDQVSHSERSSETLSTLSKRSRDDDDEDEGVTEVLSVESPNSKRARTH